MTSMNALPILIFAICSMVIGYRYYSAFLAAKVMTLDDTRITPAHRLYDGQNYHPMSRWVLFGHHFAAIAGAGPLIGPVLAAQFGWAPGLLWLVVGVVMGGAVHDFVILSASVRRDGKSLAEIARSEVNPFAGFTALLAILFIVVIALAGLGLAVVNALERSSWGTFTIAVTIPLALFMGFYMFRWRPGAQTSGTVIEVAGLILAVIVGRFIPGSFLEPWFTFSRGQLTLLLAAYGFVASVLPVWMLLCPRDYLSSYMKIGTIAALAVGVFLVAPRIQMPAFTEFVSGGGPIIPGKVYPFCFITIACGAISGFHSLVSSGTTPKMLDRESHAMIGYGAMLMESFVGVTALIAAAVLAPGDYFAINTTLSAEALGLLGYPVAHIQELSRLVEQEVMGRPGGAVSLAVGMASIFSALPGMTGLMAYWYQFALLFEALFILTTIDAGTRVARYLIQELGGTVYAPLRTINWMPGAIGASLLVVGGWGYLLATGSVSTIWPMFGAANQLLGMLALCVGTTVLIKMGKAQYLWVTAVPMIFVGVITLSGSYELFVLFLTNAGSAPAEEAVVFYLDAALIGIVATLAVVILADSLAKWYGYVIRKQPYRTSEVPSGEDGIEIPAGPCC